MRTFSGVNDAYIYYIEQLKKGDETSPRNKKIKELISVQFKIENPRQRITHNKYRQFSLSFAIGEFLWYLFGKNDLSTMQYYSSMYQNFSDDNLTLNGAYGYRIFKKTNGLSQWDVIKNKLNEDKHSRQAIINIFDSLDFSKQTKDVPCTGYLQFLIRNEKLHMIVNMRSNDIYLGLPYDIFSFTLFQELMSIELDVELGCYIHNVGSLHLYEEHYNTLENPVTSLTTEIEFPAISSSFLSEENLNFLSKIEESYRLNEGTLLNTTTDKFNKLIIEVLKEKNERYYNGK